MQMELLSSESLNNQTDVKASIPTQHKRGPVEGFSGKVGKVLWGFLMLMDSWIHFSGAEGQSFPK